MYAGVPTILIVDSFIFAPVFGFHFAVFTLSFGIDVPLKAKYKPSNGNYFGTFNNGLLFITINYISFNGANFSFITIMAIIFFIISHYQCSDSLIFFPFFYNQ